ncbi:MAG: hypothetical protein AAGA58_01070 [Verrucomicrobiota bacterium]
MPLTKLQKEILSLLAENRSERSHFAGGLVLHAADDSARFSHDFDIFHETAEDVAKCSESDALILRKAGFEVVSDGEWVKPETFRKAKIIKDGEETEIDWAADAAFRFFPIEKDPVLGWRLHLFDMATNKALALTARTETRDYIDILELGRIYPLAAICWAACGKDPGFSPLHVLKLMRRFARIRPDQLVEIQARDLDPIAMKHEWIEMSDQAEEAMVRVSNDQPDLPIGCTFVDSEGVPHWIEDAPNLHVHHGSLRGCWPSFPEKS